jgi:hypothetical protein
MQRFRAEETAQLQGNRPPLIRNGRAVTVLPK